jgi:hypothetical protein
MAKATSIRLNDDEEKMLSIVKSYLNKMNMKCSDTHIFLEGLKIQFKDISNKENERFKHKMYNSVVEIDEFEDDELNRLLILLGSICDMLEVACYSDIELLEKEFFAFIEYAYKRTNVDQSKGEDDINVKENGKMDIIYKKIRKMITQRRLDRCTFSENKAKVKKEIEIEMEMKSDIIVLRNIILKDSNL